MTRLLAALVVALVLVGCGGTTAAPPPARVVFLGNSITRHGPAPDIGWTGDWGMAASAADKDYAHLVATSLRAGAFDAVNVADWERAFETYDLELLAQYRGAELLVVKLGENVQAYTPWFPAAFDRLVASLGARHVVVVSTYWSDPQFDVVNAAMRQVATARGFSWVQLPPHDPANDAGPAAFWHLGVAGHPGDRGMAMIADLVLAELRRDGWATR